MRYIDFDARTGLDSTENPPPHAAERGRGVVNPYGKKSVSVFEEDTFEYACTF